jgi:T3SS (YopN, CesT) and YbjN peptide-binding chaperone 1
MATMSETRDRVARLLAEMVGTLQLESDGTLSFVYESTMVRVTVSSFLEQSSVVNILAVTNADLDPTPELFRYVATHADDWVFGHLGAWENEGKVFIVLRHSLLGDYLDPEELQAAVAAVATTADTLDDEVKAKFGGRLPAVE